MRVIIIFGEREYKKRKKCIEISNVLDMADVETIESHTQIWIGFLSTNYVD